MRETKSTENVRVIQGTFTYSKKVSERSKDREREREREKNGKEEIYR